MAKGRVMNCVDEGHLSGVIEIIRSSDLIPAVRRNGI